MNRMLPIALVSLSIVAAALANEPFWTEAERVEKRDVVIDGEVLSVERLHAINDREELYVAKVRVLKTHKAHGYLANTIPVHFEFSKTGENTRRPKYAEVKKGDVGRLFLIEWNYERNRDLAKRLKLGDLKGGMFLEMGSDFVKKEKNSEQPAQGDGAKRAAP